MMFLVGLWVSAYGLPYLSLLVMIRVLYLDCSLLCLLRDCLFSFFCFLHVTFDLFAIRIVLWFVF